MANIHPETGNTLVFNGQLDIPEETLNYSHSFHMGLSKITIHLGELFANYIPYYISIEDKNPENTLQIFIDHFSMQGGSQNRAALLETRFVITANENIVFDEAYLTNGGLQKRKTWGINPLIRKTTDEAVRQAFEQFSQDISDKTDPRLKKIIFADPDF